MFREFGFAFCVSEVFPMFFEFCVEVSVGSSYIKFVAVGACQFIYSMMPSQDKMTQYTNFSPHQWFEMEDQQPKPSNKQTKIQN